MAFAGSASNAGRDARGAADCRSGRGAGPLRRRLSQATTNAPLEGTRSKHTGRLGYVLAHAIAVNTGFSYGAPNTKRNACDRPAAGPLFWRASLVRWGIASLAVAPNVRAWANARGAVSSYTVGCPTERSVLSMAVVPGDLTSYVSCDVMPVHWSLSPPIKIVERRRRGNLAWGMRM